MANRLVLTVSEVAQILGLSRNSAYQGVSRGEIPSVRVGKRILVPRIALEKMLDTARKESSEVEVDNHEASSSS